MNKIEKAKEIVKENFENAPYGLFDTRNVVGDCMTNIYDDDGLCVDICYNWGYFEVFGLDEVQFGELYAFYKSLYNYKRVT